MERCFTIQDLIKLEHGANIPVLTSLKPHITNLADEVGFAPRDHQDRWSQLQDLMASHPACEVRFASQQDPRSKDPMEVRYVKEWIKTNTPTWKNLIRWLKEFGKKECADKLQDYLTSTSNSSRGVEEDNG